MRLEEKDGRDGVEEEDGVDETLPRGKKDEKTS